MSYQGMDDDSRLILAAANELEQYLASSVILWRVNGSKLPLSPGNLLLACVRLKAVNAGSSDAYAAINGLLETKRRVWENRINQEIPLRLNQYRGMVDDYLESVMIDAGYRNNISTRVKLELLLSELTTESAGNLRVLTELDSKLFKLLEDGNFIWESALIAGFPREQYSYLYINGK